MYHVTNISVIQLLEQLQLNHIVTFKNTYKRYKKKKSKNTVFFQTYK